jgi:hypothetical protein
VGDLAHWESFKSRYLSLANSLMSMYGFKYDTDAELKR